MILTNQHVVDKAAALEVVFIDRSGRLYQTAAEVVGASKGFDVALIRTTKDINAPVLPLGDSDRVRSGDWMVAFGNPLGQKHSVSAGIISSTNRRGVIVGNEFARAEFFQADAEIHPGSSGGPWTNTRGEVIAMTTAGKEAGLGLAIPVNLVKRLLPGLLKDGKFTPSTLGVRAERATVEVELGGVPMSSTAARVTGVGAGSPAAGVGLQKGDIIARFDGRWIRDPADLALRVAQIPAGQRVRIRFTRGDQTFDRMVVLAPAVKPSPSVR